ncbi:MAG: hypothetical protein QNJ34_03460, partial [Xenococcaceae cyanobacterium MO_188.B29]|nr:hypothetical protein [Xenococcaceae cyanobacterium MO_188.B29]
KEKLKQVQKVFPELGDMHRLKEELRKIFEARDSEVIGLLNLVMRNSLLLTYYSLLILTDYFFSKPYLTF